MNIRHMDPVFLATRMGRHGITREQAEAMRAVLCEAGYENRLIQDVPKAVWQKCLSRVPLGTRTAKSFKFQPDRRDPDDPTALCTNAMRANTAAVAVEAACQIRGEMEHVGEDEISDLLADLGHLCDREGLDFTTLVNTATGNWRAER